MPPPRKKKNTALWLVFGGIALFVVAVVVAGIVLVVVAGGNSTRVNSVDDVEAGECLTVKATSELVVDKVSCDSTDFHYVVAFKAFDAGLCVAADYSRLWFEDENSRTKRALCLAQVFQPGRCYHLPASSEGNALAEVREIDCTAPPSVAGATNFKVESKVSGEPDCAEGQATYFAKQPEPTGYCLTLLE
ncbi:hypothetical protein [Gordonia aurantiaca]|uniref:hypothetical protein n=1 Tax=Gordonia sp. B21 TaxID=3151852 RepID=UPI0032653996